jgi:soluble lytic murein transglycosylase-like protein
VALAFGAGDFTGARFNAMAMIDGQARGAAAWWLGLVSWRESAHEEAAHWFAVSADAPGQSGWERAAGLYWRARALTALGRTGEAVSALERAAQHGATFYGQLAEAQLGRESALDFTVDALDASSASALLARFPEAHRAAALSQLGQLSEAERELAALHNRSSQADDRLQLALAVALEAPGAQLRVAEYGGPEVAAGYCPASSFEPADGFRFDRAVLYAIVRQESRFSPIAVSRSNARGLMQLLPSTANDLDASHAFRRAPARLHDPALNMSLGQRYVEWLDASYQKGGDLARIFAAYNGGPNWLVRWEETYPRTADPLLWLESLPRWESRDYAERVLSHMALCRKRLGQAPLELAAMAAGQAAIYRRMDP